MRVKKKFVRYISHEIRTPLNAVSMGLKYLRDELPKYIQVPDILDSVATSQSACLASINILSDLLTFDKIEDGELKLDRQEISVKDLVLSSTAIFQAQVINNRMYFFLFNLCSLHSYINSFWSSCNLHSLILYVVAMNLTSHRQQQERVQL